MPEVQRSKLTNECSPLDLKKLAEPSQEWSSTGRSEWNIDFVARIVNQASIPQLAFQELDRALV